MYLSHWGLRESPYPDSLDPRHFYESPVHEEGLARLHFLVDEGRRLGLLLGGSGTGKSLLLQVFAQEMRRAGNPVALVNLAGLEAREMLWQIGAAWGVNPRRDDPPYALWRQICDRVAEFRLQGTEAVLLVDNADEGSPETQQYLVRLTHLAGDGDVRISQVLVARPERVSQIEGRLVEMATLRIDLTPWSAEEVDDYLRASLARAGRAQPAFAKEASSRLHELTKGLPRRVRQLADMALLAGAGQELEEIDPATVEAVYQELGVGE